MPHIRDKMCKPLADKILSIKQSFYATFPINPFVPNIGNVILWVSELFSRQPLS